ncbi:uncharacterized protein LOC133377214 [Rhineura floridana]|uniref:uncharacterized protein LOC133377214 n=1 Tax=Rhineura floridana TaxID=261503 RepID=UPI002AC82176|nr:uncharacterized protein LOC133377214 [Rhineura floridana]
MMAFSSEANAKFCLKLFHLLRNYHHNENILFSPLNISAALSLLYGARGNSVGQIETLSSFNQDKKEHMSSESRPDSGQPTNYTAFEASQRAYVMHDLCGEHYMSPQTPENTIHEVEDKEDGKAQEAMHKPLVEECKCEAKEEPFFPASIPVSERDAREMDSNLTHILASTVSQSNNYGVSSNILPWSKHIPKHETVEIFTQDQASSEGEAFPNLASTPENQKGSFTNRNLAAEDVRLPSFSCVKIAAENSLTPLQPFICTANVEREDPEANLVSSCLVSLTDNEAGNRKSRTEADYVQTVAGTSPQSNTEDIALHLLRKEGDEFISQEQSSVEGAVHQNQGSQEDDEVLDQESSSLERTVHQNQGSQDDEEVLSQEWSSLKGTVKQNQGNQEEDNVLSQEWPSLEGTVKQSQGNQEEDRILSQEQSSLEGTVYQNNGSRENNAVLSQEQSSLERTVKQNQRNQDDKEVLSQEWSSLEGAVKQNQRNQEDDKVLSQAMSSWEGTMKQNQRNQEEDEVLSQEQSSLEGTVHQNRENNVLLSQEWSYLEGIVHQNQENQEDNKVLSQERSSLEGTVKQNQGNQEDNEVLSEEQFSLEGTVHQNLGNREKDEILSQGWSILEGTVKQNQGNLSQSQEELSQSERIGISYTNSPSAVLFMEAGAEIMPKSQFQEFTWSMEGQDSGAEDTSLFAFLTSRRNDGSTCKNLIQTLSDTSSQLDSEDDISSDFLPWSEDFPSSEENDVASQEWPSLADKVFHNQRRSPNPQDDLLNNTNAVSPSSSSSVEGTARTMLSDAPVKEFKCTTNQKTCEKSSEEKGTSNLISLSNARLIDRQQNSHLDHQVVYSLNAHQSVPQIASSSYYLPWNKYLIGREQREALIRSRYPLRQNVSENLIVSPENSRYNRHNCMHRLPLVSVQSYACLLRSKPF